jgi:hypothetical protein
MSLKIWLLLMLMAGISAASYSGARRPVVAQDRA